MAAMGKRILLGVAAVGVISVGYFGVRGFPSVGDQGKGAIGTAERYRGQQLTSADVVLKNPEAQQWLQSDSFHRLVNDPVARRALASPEFRALLASLGFRAALAD